LNVPSQIADFLIEMLSTEQPPNLRHTSPKVFRNPSLFSIRFPEPIPMLFSSPEPRRTRIGFFDSPFESAISLEHRLSRMLSILSHRHVLTAEFHNVDSQCSLNISHFADSLNVKAVRIDCDSDSAMETQTFVVRILQIDWDERRRNEIEAALRESFAVSELLFCVKCNHLFCLNDGSSCGVREHSGKRIAFPNGLSEVIEEGIIWWCFECCGKVRANGSECHEVGKHEMEQGRTFSRLIINEVSLFGDMGR
jgi:hypothetical protein